ncbi:MAG: polysaccharide deacetylase family protein [Gammaproteobacteria bacterium]
MFKQILAGLFLLLPLSIANADNVPDTNKNPPKGTVALTFDDGPNPTYTREVLAILKKYNVKATFFVVGANAKKYPELIKEIHEQGHVVASHSETHPMLTNISETQLQNEIIMPVTIVNNIIGIKPKCLRYPFGASNEHVRAEIRAHGMMPVPMGFNSFDYDRPGTEKISSWVLKNAYSGQVILMHDGYDKREQTVAALPVIIEGIQKKGLGFSTICG